MTTTIGPRQPGETREQYIQRVVEAAPRPNPDQLARLASLLRSGRDLRRPVPVKGDARG